MTKITYKILYQKGKYWVAFSLVKEGYLVFKEKLTHSICVARIGFEGEAGLNKAKQEADKRDKEDPIT